MRRSRVFFFLFIALICAGHISEGNGGQSSEVPPDGLGFEVFEWRRHGTESW